MDLVVDIQCVMNVNNTYIPKEVALLSLADAYIGHWIVAPPYSAKKLPISVKRTNKWLSRNKHGLEWEDGFITRPALVSHLREICKNVEKVYVRGAEKKKILENIILNEIINLEEDEEEKIPSFADLAWSNTYCILHASRPNASVAFSCALNNAVRLKNWLKTYQLKSIDGINDEQLRNFESALADTSAYNGCLPCG